MPLTAPSPCDEGSTKGQSPTGLALLLFLFSLVLLLSPRLLIRGSGGWPLGMKGEQASRSSGWWRRAMLGQAIGDLSHCPKLAAWDTGSRLGLAQEAVGSEA